MRAARNFKKILVMRGGALGDFVLTLPALAALRKRFPASRLEILGYPRVAELAVAGGLADVAHSIEAPALARYFAANAPGANRFAGYDLMVSYIFDPENIFEANVRRDAPEAVFLKGPHRPDDTGNIHATDVLLSPLRELGIEGADPQPRLILSNGTDRRGRLALHPGSGSERKNWPEANWGGLIREILEKTRWNCLLVGGEAEAGRLERLQDFDAGRSKFGKDRIELAQNLPLVELARIMQGCAGFVGHDSGVTHLAAAVGLQGLALWGETNANVWRPRSDRMKVAHHDKGLSRLPVEDVFGKLAELGIV
jgi:heptosyltransferase-3